MSDMSLEDHAELISDLAEDLVEQLAVGELEAVGFILEDLDSSVSRMRLAFNRACW